jgi:hypothetical protein
VLEVHHKFICIREYYNVSNKDNKSNVEQERKYEKLLNDLLEEKKIKLYFIHKNTT